MKLEILLFAAAPFLVAQTTVDLAVQRNPDFSLLSPTRPFQILSSLPGTCIVGQTIFSSSSNPGNNIYSCTLTNVWTLEGGGASIPSVTNLISGNGSGNGADSGITPASVLTLTGTQTTTNKTVDGISPTIFGYLSGITSSVQTQLTSKEPSFGVTISGVPNVGQAPIATSSTTATWQDVSMGSGGATIANTTDLISGNGSGDGSDSGIVPSNVVQLTATQTLTGKTLDGVTPTTFGYLDATSSIQSQLNGKLGTSGNAVSATNLSSYPTLCSGGQFSQGLSAGSNNCGTPAGGGGGGGSPLTVQTNGTSTGTASTILNFKSGTGIIQSCMYDSGNSSNDCTPSMNTALIPTHDQIHYNENYQTSTNGTTAMTTSSPNKALLMYQAGECFDFVTDTSNPVSINIDGIGVINLYLGDGATALPTGTVLAGYPFTACNDGTVFRLKSSSVTAIPSLEVPLLGLVIGTNVQAYSSTLTTWAGKTPPAGMVVGTSDTQTLTNKTIASTEITGLPTFPAGTIVGTTDTQTLTNKSIAVSQLTGTYSPATLNTASNCSSAASPAVCGSAATGSVVIAASTTSIVVNTTAVTANSEILVQSDDSLGTKLSVTCNSTLANLVAGFAITARIASTSFTISTTGTILSNPICLSYAIIN
jgi:hypothetical protein